MRRAWLFFLFFSLCVSAKLSAQNQSVGVGIILGEPTGFSFKKWISPKTAFDAAIAWSFEGENALHVHADYVFHNNRDIAARARTNSLYLYYGIGGRIKFQDDGKLGVRFPVGLNYQFVENPLDFFIEIVPILEFVPNTEFDLNAALGVRFFFK